MALTEGHHALIQTFLSRGPQPEADARRLAQELTDGSLQDQSRRINAALGVLQLELRAGKDQKDGAVWYSIVNKTADKEAKLGTTYSHAQIQLFKAIVENLAQKPDGAGVMSNIEIHHLVMRPLETQTQVEDEAGPSTNSQRVSAPKTLTGAEKERTVEQLVQEKWFERAEVAGEPQGGIRLGIRTYLELRQFLRGIENAVLCEVCDDVVVEAACCPSEDCGYRLHRHCVEARFGAAPGSDCPVCGTPWPQSASPGGRGEAEDDEPRDVKRKPAAKVPGRVKRERRTS